MVTSCEFYWNTAICRAGRLIYNLLSGGHHLSKKKVFFFAVVKNYHHDVKNVCKSAGWYAVEPDDIRRFEMLEMRDIRLYIQV